MEELCVEIVPYIFIEAQKSLLLYIFQYQRNLILLVSLGTFFHTPEYFFVGTNALKWFVSTDSCEFPKEWYVFGISVHITPKNQIHFFRRQKRMKTCECKSTLWTLEAPSFFSRSGLHEVKIPITACEEWKILFGVSTELFQDIYLIVGSHHAKIDYVIADILCYIFAKIVFKFKTFWVLVVYLYASKVVNISKIGTVLIAKNNILVLR